MKIEFSTIGDGTNVEVSLLEDLGGTDHTVDRIYTADHQGGLHFDMERGVPCHAQQLFQWVEDSWAKPIIGGRYGHLHPYWYERKEKRKRQNMAMFAQVPFTNKSVYSREEVEGMLRRGEISEVRAEEVLRMSYETKKRATEAGR